MLRAWDMLANPGKDREVSAGVALENIAVAAVTALNREIHKGTVVVDTATLWGPAARRFVAVVVERSMACSLQVCQSVASSTDQDLYTVIAGKVSALEKVLPIGYMRPVFEDLALPDDRERPVVDRTWTRLQTCTEEAAAVQ